MKEVSVSEDDYASGSEELYWQAHWTSQQALDMKCDAAPNVNAVVQLSAVSSVTDMESGAQLQMSLSSDSDSGGGGSEPEGTTRTPVAAHPTRPRLQVSRPTRRALLNECIKGSSSNLSPSKCAKTVLWHNDRVANYRLEAQLRCIRVRNDRRPVTRVMHRKRCRKRARKFSGSSTGKDTIPPSVIRRMSMGGERKALPPTGMKDFSTSPCDPGGYEVA